MSGKFNDENLKEGYNLKKKRFVDFMDNYILLIYFARSIMLSLWKNEASFEINQI